MLLPAAPAGMAAPPLASATKLIPDPARGPVDDDDTMFVPAAAVAAAANGSGGAAAKPPVAPAPAVATAAAATAAAAAAAASARGTGAGAGGAGDAPSAPLADATQAIPAVAAASARTPSATPRAGAAAAGPHADSAAPPRVQIGGDPAAAATRREASRTARPGQPILPPMDDERGTGRRLAGRVLPLLIGGIAVVVIIVGLIVITNSGGTTTANVNHGNGSSQTGENVSNQQHKPAPFKASKYTVAVLNGTAVSGLAGDVSTKLAASGFKKGNATNASSQTYGSTVVYYLPGKNATDNRLAAVHVAKTLTLPASRVHTATQSSIKSCSTSASGASLGSCSADVIVLVGSDRAGLASGGSGG